MRAFATLLDRLVLTPSRNGKLKLLADYFASVPDPDRGYALGVLAGTLDLKTVKPALLKELVLERMDPVLFGYSYDYVGDLAETISLVWDQDRGEKAEIAEPSLGEVVALMQSLGRTQVRGAVRDLLDQLDTSGRFAFLKLATGGLRIGVSARLAKQALSEMSGKDVGEIETLWHGLEPPYESLFAWLEGGADKPVLATPAIFHSVMLSTPVGNGDLDGLDPADFAAEWKWDGIRVQLSRHGDTCRLYSRSGDDISGAFPDIVAAANFDGVIDGELLVGGTARSNQPTRSFSDLQQRLNRKSVTTKMLSDYPAFIRAYDLLFTGDQDVRNLGYEVRRGLLAEIVEKAPATRFDLSPLISFSNWDELDALRHAPPDPVIEGVMIKRRDSIYQAGRAKGPWFKWKKQPLNVDAVLMYAQRGHGKRSSYYSDFTFGVWMQMPEGGSQLVPVGKAYFGFTDQELEILDKYVRNNTIDRFGPVRSIRAEPDHGFVVEVAFEGLNRSTRHKSGVAMRFPRISRLRSDKLPRDADRLETLLHMLPA
ncbi:MULTISPECIES: cisplatin damage response ATP-dependent DNA ligase [Rhizobium/Agrobacterium group]|nr:MULTISPECIES: cisplatin damage response ATP-dependent DNA ligase [Rhizobium/Agrobacterium group]MCF1449641.1 cisplatin damage response ATP-dependent DNA ligase [Allorhizobium ampelinum]MCF1495148.1 cisplatin damage response ATP-dependent DNA ligase [Allorhizobium ampelinum]MUO31072.1 cisplatin damage response ATP-dependent DNA ligase [Agrobacterium vitis]MUO44502.1 cisplatin damage response ATP-dependent DNA ligase [Agrobacterium vitis]MUP12618.1 cisplatin damage response ATP-dependent DNA 